MKMLQKVQEILYNFEGVFSNLKNLVNMVQNRTSYVNRYKNELIFCLMLFGSTT